MRTKKSICVLLYFFLLTTFIFSEPADFQVAVNIEWKEKVLVFDISRNLNILNGYTPDKRYSIEKEVDEQFQILLFNAIIEMPVDSGYVMHDYIQSNSEVYEKLESGIKLCKKEYAQILNNKNKVIIRYSWPLYGNRGLAACFINHKATHPLPVRLGFTATKKYSGILIYAVGDFKLYGEKNKGALQPVLFPDFYDEDMNLFFSKAHCDPAYIQKWGMVEYTDEMDEKKYTERIGTNPLRTTPIRLFGKLASDLIFPRDVVNKILYREDNRQLLREGRILIICNGL